MKHNYLNFDQAHRYVEESTKTPSKEVFWDGWTDIVIWKKTPGGYMVKNGLYRNGQWGTARHIKMNDNGAWRLPEKP